jgi:dihydropteroate synthase
MAIVNVTPDSFSDGGRYFSPASAIEHALRMEDEGADILDIGGESTRPYSEPVSVEEELSRVVPVMEGLSGRVQIPISIDTSKSQVAQAALQLGAEIINDVSGLTADPEMAKLAASEQAAVCAMHMQGTPQTMQDSPTYENVVDDILGYLRERMDSLISLGIAADRICLDPGIGFGKTHEHNLELLKNSQRFIELGTPILIGHSRKGFIGKILNDKSADRSAGSVAMSLFLAQQGIQLVRVHDVLATKQAMLCFSACGGFGS